MWWRHVIKPCISGDDCWQEFDVETVEDWVAYRPEQVLVVVGDHQLSTATETNNTVASRASRILLSNSGYDLALIRTAAPIGWQGL